MVGGSAQASLPSESQFSLEFFGNILFLGVYRKDFCLSGSGSSNPLPSFLRFLYLKFFSLEFRFVKILC
jgi:hypothetical protein